MTIKQNGGVFGRNPTFNDVTIEGQLTFDGDIDINSDLKVDGDIETTGNVIIATSGKGIDFSATAGTGTSELFSDYEEGVWTPSFVNLGTGTLSVQVGVYTKVGNIVTASCHLDIGVAGTASGDLTISGLPFTSASTANSYGSATTPYTNGWTADLANLGGLSGISSTIFSVKYMNTSGNAANATHAEIGTGSMIFTIIYTSA